MGRGSFGAIPLGPAPGRGSLVPPEVDPEGLLTGGGEVIVIIAEASLPFDLPVTVTFPAARALRSPFSSIAATLGSVKLQSTVISFSEPSLNLPMAFNFTL